MQQFEMTQGQLDKILEACRPVQMIALQCGTPKSSQENANAAWAELGNSMGFKPMTVQPVAGKSNLFFTAEPV